MSIYRVLGVLREFAHTVPQVESLQAMMSKERLGEMARLYKQNVSNANWQAGSHLATAGLCLAAGVFATQLRMDASSAITVSSKLGEAGTTVVRSWETGTTGELRRVEHDVNKGSDAGKRFTEFFQQFMRNVETMSQHRSRARLSQ
ncbi:MAG: hypothetical protein KGZ39_02695 [Simkania sp.]|nr:hypothetical protein [Simkania sp.]